MKTNQTQKKHHKHIDWRRVFVTVLAIIMLLSLLLPSAMLNAHAVTQSELKNQISGLKDDASAAAERKKELQQQLQALEKDEKKAMERHAILAQQLSELEGQIANTQAQIDTYAALIAEQEIALADAQAAENQAYERFCQRARSMEESGTISYWPRLGSRWRTPLPNSMTPRANWMSRWRNWTFSGWSRTPRWRKPRLSWMS